MSETTPYRVLSLDGGGIRGLYTASLLHQLSLRFSRLDGGAPKGNLDLGAKFDLIVGTSTGSILAMALAAGASLEQVIALYRTEGAKIFTKQMPLQHGCLSDKILALLWTLLRARSPANHSQPLRAALEKVLGDVNFDDLYTRRKICLPREQWHRAFHWRIWFSATKSYWYLTWRSNPFWIKLPVIDTCMFCKFNKSGSSVPGFQVFL